MADTTWLRRCTTTRGWLAGPRSLALAGWLLVGGLAASCHHPDQTDRPTMSDYTTEKFKLAASPAAPDGYQMVIFDGVFHRTDGQTFPVPTGHRLVSGWRGSSISWAVGDEMQPAPDSLNIVWYSTVEDQFYAGDFAMPQQRIHDLLKTGFWNTERQVQQTYDELTVLVGPKGMVVVWLAGSKNKVLLGRYQGHPVASQFEDESPQAHAQYVREERATLPPAVQQQIAAGAISTRKWDEYLRTYPWQVTFNQPLKLYDYGIDYLNAERTNYPATRDMAAYAKHLLAPSPKAVPHDMALFVETEAGQRHEIRIVAFDETETMAAFQTLQKSDPQQPIQLYVELDKPLQRARLLLKNNLQQVELSKTKVEVYRAD